MQDKELLLSSGRMTDWVGTDGHRRRPSSLRGARRVYIGAFERETCPSLIV